MHQNAGNMPQNFLGNTLQYLYKYDNFWIYFKKHLIKIYTNTHQFCTIFKNFLGGSVPVMYAHLLFFEKKNTIRKVHFSQFLKDPLQFIKLTLPWLHQLF